jgi:histidinol-phosphate aminotransferase
MQSIDRRSWLKKSTLASLGWGLTLQAMAGEDYLPRQFNGNADLINLGFNENPYGISPLAKQAINDFMGNANRYPMNVKEVAAFKKTLAERLGVGENNLLLTAGSGEGLNLLARAYAGGDLVTATPTFPILPSTSKKMGVSVQEIPLTEDKLHDLVAMQKAITPKTSLVYICNPSNPTGTTVNPESLKAFCLEASRTTNVVIDEAYIDLVDPPMNVSMRQLIHDNPRMIIISTFSKIHAMAGLRVGYIVSHPSTIQQLESSYFQQAGMCVSVLSSVAAAASLNDQQHIESCKRKNAAVRQYTFEKLQQMGYRTIPSHTNFLFFATPGYPGDFARDMLEKHKIVLRSYTYPDGKWARVSIGTQSEMDVFLNKLKEMR